MRSFLVNINGDTFVTEGESIDTVTNALIRAIDGPDAKIIKEGDTRAISFSTWGIKHKTTVTVEPTK